MEHEQPRAGIERRLLEWLKKWTLGLALPDLEETAFHELTYAEYCQFQEWEHDYEDVGDVLDMLYERRAKAAAGVVTPGEGEGE